MQIQHKQFVLMKHQEQCKYHQKMVAVSLLIMEVLLI